MLIFEDLIRIMEKALDSETLDLMSLDEKITSKKALKRKRRAAKKAAAKAAAEQAKKEEQSNQEDVEEQNNESNDSFKELVKYDDSVRSQEQAQDYSEAFKQFIGILNKIIEKYSPMWDQADQIWQSAGKDKPCPKEAYELYSQAIEGAQEDFKTLIETEFPKYAENMLTEEVSWLETQFTAVNGFLEKKAQLIATLDPTKITQKDKNKKDEKPKEDGYEDLVIYTDFKKTDDKLQETWDQIKENQETLAKTPFKDFAVTCYDVTKWFNNSLWSFINSKLGKSMLASVMLSNPVTAMIFKGDLGSFSLNLKPIDNYVEKRKQKKEQEKEKNKELKEKNKELKEKNKYNDRGILNDVPTNLNVGSLKQILYGNENFVGWVNVCYNHSDVSYTDKATIQKCTKYLNNEFSRDMDPNHEEQDKKDAKPNGDLDRDKIIQTLSTLIKTVNKVCDYMGWNSVKDLQKAQEESVAGNTKEQKEKIDKDSEKSEEEKIDWSKVTVDDINNNKYDLDKISFSSTDFQKMSKDVRTLIMSKISEQKSESYVETLTNNLLKLLEEAEA